MRRSEGRSPKAGTFVVLVLTLTLAACTGPAPPGGHTHHGGSGTHRTTSPKARPSATCTPRCAWISAYDGPASGQDQAIAIGVAPSGSTVFVTGVSRGTGPDFATVAFDTRTGSELWASRYDGGGTDVPAALAVDPRGRGVYVTGESPGRNGSYDFATVAYDAATGEQRWVARSGGEVADRPSEVEVSPDGEIVYVAGGWENEAPHEGLMTIAYRASTGAELWESNLEVGPSSLGGLALSTDGDRVFVSGTYDTEGRNSAVTTAFGARTGDELWTEHLGGGLLLATGQVVVVTGGIGRPPAVLALDPRTGSKLWETPGLARGIVASPDGRSFYVLAGGTSVVAYRTASGERLWAAKEHWAWLAGIAVSSDGRTVYATGGRFGTVGFAAGSGRRVWTGSYVGPAGGPDISIGLAADPKGRFLYVAGTSRRGGSRLGYATAAYIAG